MDKGDLAEGGLQRPHDGESICSVGEIDAQHASAFGQGRQWLTLSEAVGERAAEVRLAREGRDDKPFAIADEHTLAA